MIEEILKPWGKEEILEKNNHYVLKRLTMLKGHQCSLQYHEKKHETIYVIEGKLHLRVHDNWFIYKPGDFVALKPNTVHRMRAIESNVIYLEASTPELNDVVRLEDDYRKIV